MEQVDWQGIMERTLLDILGPPLQETDGQWFWAGKESTRGDQSRSFKYERQGKWAGCFRDWSTGQGGRVYAFLAYWCDMDKDRATAYLREKGWLPERGGGPPRLVVGGTPGAGMNGSGPPLEAYDRDAVALCDALIAHPEGVEEAYHNSLAEAQQRAIEHEQAQIKAAWIAAPDPMLEALEQLCRDDPCGANYRALQVHVAARSVCLEHVSKKGIGYPPLWRA